MKIDEKTFKAMPADLQALFRKLPNPGSEEVLGLMPSPHGAGSARAGSKNPRPVNYSGNVPIAPPSHTGNMFRFGDSGSAARFFYCAKASKRERNAGCEAVAAMQCGVGALRDNGRGKTATNHHPTVKPVALMRYLVRLVTPPGGLVLDPFCGSGSAGIACVHEGFRFVGIDMQEEYCNIAQARIGATPVPLL